jgi:hypothetical protein
MLRVVAVGKTVAHDRIGEAARMPGARECQQRRQAADGFENGL